MESLEDSNCQSTNDSFSLYERYMRSFNVANNTLGNFGNSEASEGGTSHSDSGSSNSRENIDLSTAQEQAINKHNDLRDTACNIIDAIECNIRDKGSSLDAELKVDSPCHSPAPSPLDTSSATIEQEHSLLTDKSNQTDVLVSSEESKRESFKQPIFITSTMENSNNAVDSVPMFRDVRHTESVFKLPISELSFNGTIKHVKQLKPIVDPISALSSNNLDNLDEKYLKMYDNQGNYLENELGGDQKSCDQSISNGSDETNDTNRADKLSESTGDSQYEEDNNKQECPLLEEGSTSKWNMDQTHSSFDASFDSGVRSPDLFSDHEDDVEPQTEPFWNFLKDFEAYDKRKIKKSEESLLGVLPPPSVTTLKIDVTEMLKRYHTFLPIFNDGVKETPTENSNSTTPTKRMAFIEIPDVAQHGPLMPIEEEKPKSSNSKDSNISGQDLNTSVADKTIDLKMSSEIEAVETAWPDILKCRHFDVYYNVTKYSEKFEQLSLRYLERYVRGETTTSVNIHSGGFQSPSSASKRKALRLKLAQAKSPGRRLSHLARRRQAFCTAATINEKAQSSSSRMVLIDKNYFPHRKLINSAERKSPRLVKRTPGKKTPGRKTPGKKTPVKTPKTRSGGSSRKKAMRRLLLDSDSLSKSQPSRENLKRALFVSPERKKSIPSIACSSVPVQMKTKRALFGSPDRLAETKSSDGTQSDTFLKRKRDVLDDRPESSRSKIAKSLSFGGDTFGSSQSISLSRRASELFTAKKSAELNEHHKQKLLWAVTEALRVHGWRMSSPGFREKAGLLARLVRRLLTLPHHAAKLAASHLSTSDTLLKIARLYVFNIIQGRTVDECFQEEQMKLSNDANNKLSGYISAAAYQQIRARHTATSTWTSQIKENSFNTMSSKPEQPKSATKNVLQDKLVNIDSNSNSSSGLGSLDKSNLSVFKSNSMPSFEEAAKMRARRQISFDNVDFPKR